MTQKEFLNIVMPFKDKVFRLAKRLLVSTEEAEVCFDKLKSKQAQNLKLVHSNYESKNTPLQKQMELKDSVSWVAKIIEDLPEQQKLIIQLRDIEDYDFDEIAKILDMNNASVRVALSRARKTIREKLTNTHNYGVRNCSTAFRDV